MSANAGFAFFAAVPIRLILSVVRSGLARMQARLASDGCPIARPLAGGAGFTTSPQRPGSLPGLCGDVVRAAQPARGRATAPRRVSGGEPVRLGGRFGIPKGRAPWARVPGRAAPAVLVGRHLRLACGRRLRGASSALGRARSKRPRKGRRPLPRAGMRLLSADGGVAMGRRGTGPCLRSRAGPALSAAEATRRPGGPGRRRGRLALVAAELVDVMPE